LVLTCDDNFIFSVSIIIITTIQICKFFTLRMPSEYYCPHCNSKEVIEYDDHIECLLCGLEFSIESLESDIEEENILAEEELQGVADAFDEEERKKLEKMFEEDDFS